MKYELAGNPKSPKILLLCRTGGGFCLSNNVLTFAYIAIQSCEARVLVSPTITIFLDVLITKGVILADSVTMWKMLICYMDAMQIVVGIEYLCSVEALPASKQISETGNHSSNLWGTLTSTRRSCGGRWGKGGHPHQPSLHT